MAKSDVKIVDNLHGPEEELVEPKKSYVPDGFETVEDYLQDMRETYELDLEADGDNRAAAMEDRKFAAGEQWDPMVLEQRQGLPCLVINSIPQFVAQLVGDWRQNKSAVKVIPSEDGDREVASIRSDLVRSIEQKSRADRVYANSFESMITCSDGAFRVGVQYATEDVFDQDIVLKPIDDALSVVWDRLSVDPTGRDATHCFVDDVIPLKEFNRRWPDHNPSSMSDREAMLYSKDGWCDSGTVRVTEHWRMIERKKLLVLFEDGSVYPFPENAGSDEIDQFIDVHGQPKKYRLSPCKYAQMHLVTGFAVLSGPYEWKLSRLPIIRMSGRVVSLGDRRVRYGLVRFMKDAARLRNFWRSEAAAQLGMSSKSVWIAPESAVEGREAEFERDHATRKRLITYNDGAEAPPERVDPPPVQMALLNEAQVNTQDMKDVTGIHDASLGIKSNETSGRAIMARQREGDVASLTYYDNGNAAILEAGDVINQLIPQIYDGTRIVRIIGEDESAKLVKINDPMDPSSPNLATSNYDVAITTGASYTTRRVEAAEAMMEAVQVFPELMQVAGDLVAKAQDWPGAEEMAERLRKTIPPHLLSEKERAEMGEEAGVDPQAMMEQQAQMQEQMQKAMLELEKLTQENQQLKLNVENEAKKLEIDRFEAETARIKVMGELAAKDEEFELREKEHNAQLEENESDREIERTKAKASANKNPSSGGSKPKPSK